MNRQRCSAILTVLALEIFTCPAFGAVEIPFKLSGHLIVVEASIGEQHNLSMVIDTGSTNSLIAPVIAKRLGLETTTGEIIALGTEEVSIRESILESLRIGDLEFAEVLVRIGPLPTFSRLRVDGLIGLNVLRRTNWILDYKERKLIAGLKHSIDGSQSFYPDLPYVPVRLTINGEWGVFMLDTGTDRLLLFGERIRDRFTLVNRPGAEAIDFLGGRARLRKVLVHDLCLGDTCWRNMQAHVLRSSRMEDLGLDGILGPIALGLKEIHLDFLNSRIRVQK